MKDIILFGGGGHGYATAALIKSNANYTLRKVYDDNPKESTIIDIPLLAYKNEDFSNKLLGLSIGSNTIRKQKALQFKNAIYPTIAHSSSVIYPSSKIGKGNFILPLTVVDADCKIGDFCIINNHATVSHQVMLENYVHIAIQAAIAGGVTIGEGTLIGAGSVVLPEIKIGKWAIIGAGAVVTKDVPDFAVVYGNPAKIIKYQKA